MEENKRDQTFAGDFRSGRNLVNLRNDMSKAAAPAPAPIPALPKETPAKPMLSMPSTGNRTVRDEGPSNFFDSVFEYGLYALVMLMPLFVLPFTFEVQEFNKYFLLIALTSLLLFVWVVNGAFIKGSVQIAKSSLTAPFALLLGVFALSAFLGVDRITSLMGYYGTFSDSVIFYAGLFVFYLLSLGLIAQRGAERVVSSFVGYSVYSSILVSFISLSYFLGVKILPGFGGTAGFNPVSGYIKAYAIYLLVMVFVALYDYYALRTSRQLGKVADVLAIISVLSVLVLIGWVPVFVVLSAGLILVILSGGFLGKGKLSSGSGLLMLALLILGVGLTVSSLDLGKLAQGQLVVNGSSVSASMRGALNIDDTSNLLSANVLPGDEASSITGRGIKEKPLLGSGIGTYFYDFSKYRSSEFNYNDNWSLRFSKAGSEMLEKVSTVGVLGMASYLILLLLAAYLLFKNARHDKRETFLLVAFLSLAIFQFLFLETAVLKFFFVLLLILAAANGFSGESRTIVLASRRSGSKGAQAKVTGRILPASAIAVVLICSAVLFLDMQMLRAEAKYKALSNGGDVSALEMDRLEEVNKIYPFRGEYALGLSRLYITRVNASVAKVSGASDQQALEKVKAESDKALYYTRRATELSPNNVSLWENYGFVYRRMSDLGMEGADEWAIKGFESALNLDPNNAVYKTEIGKVFLQRYQKSEGDEKDANLDKAKAAFQEAIALKSDYPDAVTELALVYFFEGDQAKALETVNQARSLKKISVATAVQIGKIYYNLGKLSEAQEALAAAIKVNPKNSDAHYILGVIYKEQKRDQEALAEFKAVLELNPGNQDVADKINSLEGGAKIGEKDSGKDVVKKSDTSEQPSLPSTD